MSSTCSMLTDLSCFASDLFTAFIESNGGAAYDRASCANIACSVSSWALLGAQPSAIPLAALLFFRPPPMPPPPSICTMSPPIMPLKPDCWERGHDTVNVGTLAVGTIAHDFPAADVNLLLSKGLASNSRSTSVLTDR